MHQFFAHPTDLTARVNLHAYTIGIQVWESTNQQLIRNWQNQKMNLKIALLKHNSMPLSVAVAKNRINNIWFELAFAEIERRRPPGSLSAASSLLTLSQPTYADRPPSSLSSQSSTFRPTYTELMSASWDGPWEWFLMFSLSVSQITITFRTLNITIYVYISVQCQIMITIVIYM